MRLVVRSESDRSFIRDAGVYFSGRAINQPRGLPQLLASVIVMKNLSLPSGPQTNFEVQVHCIINSNQCSMSRWM